MKEIIIRNAENAPISVNVVRFFKLNGIEYLIFSLNEVDDGGYVKLYVSKVSDGVGKIIEDDVEWNLIKDTIKTIIKSNKDNLPLPITDLETSRINNIQILDQKIFKLNDSLLQLLTLNKKEEVSSVVDFAIGTQDGSTNIPSVDTVNLESLNDGVLNGVAVTNTDFSNNIESKAVEQNPVVEPLQFNNNMNVETPQTEYELDYRTLYNNELKKNEDLTIRIEKYENIIDNLKNILNQQI